MNEENSVCIRINVKIQFIESSSVAKQSFTNMVVVAGIDSQVIIMTIIENIDIEITTSVVAFL